MQIMSRIDSTGFQALVERADLNENRNVPSRADRHDDSRHFHSQNSERAVFKPDPVIFLRFIPSLQVNDQLHSALVKNSAHAEELFQVNDP